MSMPVKHYSHAKMVRELDIARAWLMQEHFNRAPSGMFDLNAWPDEYEASHLEFLSKLLDGNHDFHDIYIVGRAGHFLLIEQKKQMAQTLQKVPGMGPRWANDFAEIYSEVARRGYPFHDALTDLDLLKNFLWYKNNHRKLRRQSPTLPVYKALREWWHDNADCSSGTDYQTFKALYI